MARTPSRFKGLVGSVVTLPLVLPPVATGLPGEIPPAMVSDGSSVERMQDARPGPLSLVEGSQVVFLVRGMDAVVRQRKADQQRFHAEIGLEIPDDRDRSAHGDHHQVAFLQQVYRQEQFIHIFIAGVGDQDHQRAFLL